MDDLISRQAAIDILDAFQVKVENGEEFSYSWARMRMTELPSTQPKISSSETPNTSDTISRQDAIDVLAAMQGRCTSKAALIQNSKIWQQIKDLPSAQPDLDEWCTDCSEYDSERHCCPRFNRVIRDAVEEAKKERINCAHCKRYDSHGHRCKWWNHGVSNVDWCSYAERKEEHE